MSTATFPITASTSVSPQPFVSNSIKATTTAPVLGPSHDPQQHLRSRANSGDGNKIFKVYKYVDQSLLDENIKEIQLLRSENIQLKQTMQLWEQRMRVLELSIEKHRQANSLARNVLQSHRDDDDVPRERMTDAFDALEETLRL